jgi:hypothetical protein
VGALGRYGLGDAAEDRGPQDPSIGAARGGEGPTPDMLATVDTTATSDTFSTPEVESEVEMMVAAGATSSPIASEVAG